MPMHQFDNNVQILQSNTYIAFIRPSYIVLKWINWNRLGLKFNPGCYLIIEFFDWFSMRTSTSSYAYTYTEIEFYMYTKIEFFENWEPWEYIIEYYFLIIILIS